MSSFALANLALTFLYRHHFNILVYEATRLFFRCFESLNCVAVISKNIYRQQGNSVSHRWYQHLSSVFRKTKAVKIRRENLTEVIGELGYVQFVAMLL